MNQTQISVNTSRSLSWLEKAFLAFNGVLAIGVIGSVAAVTDPWGNPLNICSLILVAVGTIGVSALGWVLSKRTFQAIAVSNAEAKFANERAELARLEAEKLRARMAWRRLGAAQRLLITEALQRVPANQREQIVVEYVDDDPECETFALDFLSAITAAGFDTYKAPMWRQAVGLKHSGADRPTGQALSQAFSGLGFEFRAQVHGFARDEHQAHISILVGSKPPPPEANINW